MSGHSKWSTIKRKKGANDAQKAKEFTKIARLITVAAQNGGGDAAMNPALALAIAKGKAVNMPNDNIDRAIKRGTGEGGAGGRLEEVAYESYAPGNVAIIVDCTTDNRNRTVSELRSRIEKAGGRWADNGAISWQFKTIGRIVVEFATEAEIKERESAKWNTNTTELPRLNKASIEEFELGVYDIPGVEDVQVDLSNGVMIITEYSFLNSVKKAIEEKGVRVSDAGLEKVSSNQIELSDEEIERLEKFIEIVEENDDVQKVWTNVANY